MKLRGCSTKARSKLVLYVMWPCILDYAMKQKPIENQNMVYQHHQKNKSKNRDAKKIKTRGRWFLLIQVFKIFEN